MIVSVESFDPLLTRINSTSLRFNYFEKSFTSFGKLFASLKHGITIDKFIIFILGYLFYMDDFSIN